MNQNHVLDISAEVPIGSIFLQGEAKLTAEDMEVAGILLKSGGLPQNARIFFRLWLAPEKAWICIKSA